MQSSVSRIGRQRKNLNERMADREMCKEKGRKILDTKTMKKRKNEK